MTSFLKTRFFGNDPEVKVEPKTFTQEQVNALLADNKRGMQEQLKNTTAELEKFKAQGGNAKELEAKIAELSNSLMTKEELAKQTLDKARTDSENQVKALSAEKDSFKNRFHETLISQAITTAGVKHIAYDPNQLMMLFGNKAEVMEVTDDAGKGTNAFKVMLPVTVDGKVVKLEADQAIEQLRKDKSYGNLFKTDVVGGTGKTLSDGPTGTVDKTLSDNTDQYMAQRAAHKKNGTL